MSLKETIEETKQQLAEALEKEGTEVPEEVEEVEDPIQEEEPEEDNEPEETVEEDNPEEEKDLTAKEKNAEFARLRREKRALELELKKVKEQTDKPVEAVEDPEPNRKENYEAWLEWNIRSERKAREELQEKFSKYEQERQSKEEKEALINHFSEYERSFKAIEPSYDEAATYYTSLVAQATKILYPHATPKQIASVVEEQMLIKGKQYEDAGLDPAEALFNEAVEAGFKASAKEMKVKPSLSKVAANKARNANMAGSRGRGGAPDLTPLGAASMTTAEFAKLTPDQKKQIYAKLR